MPIRAAIHESRPDIADRAGIYCRKSIPPAGGIKKSTIFNINLKIMRLKLFLLLLLSAALPVLAQTASVAGVVVDANTGTPVSGATVMLRDQGLASTTGPAGDFRISNAAPGQDYVMVVAYGYADAEKAVELFNKQTVDAGLIRLADNEQHTDYYEDQNDLIFDESALEDEEGAGQSIGALTGASDNIFYNAANYDFSQMYFRQRGYDRWYQQTYINGVNFNDLARGYFNYSSIGGMNRAFRNKTTAIGLDAADFGFGDLGGQTNISTRATDYAPGFNGSVMYTNSNYMFRAMALYSTGLNKHGWALTAGAIGRYAKEGIVPGSFYNSGGYFLAVEKVFNRQHSLSLTAFGAPTQRAGLVAHNRRGPRTHRHQSLQPQLGLVRRQETRRPHRGVVRSHIHPQLAVQTSGRHIAQHRCGSTLEQLQLVGTGLLQRRQPAGRLLPQHAELVQGSACHV